MAIGTATFMCTFAYCRIHGLAPFGKFSINAKKLPPVSRELEKMPVKVADLVMNRAKYAENYSRSKREMSVWCFRRRDLLPFQTKPVSLCLKWEQVLQERGKTQDDRKRVDLVNRGSRAG